MSNALRERESGVQVLLIGLRKGGWGGACNGGYTSLQRKEMALQREKDNGSEKRRKRGVTSWKGGEQRFVS